MLPTIRNILYATDLSESARRALGYAVSLAGHYKASLTILHVVRDVVELMSEEAASIREHFGSEARLDFMTRPCPRPWRGPGSVREAARNAPRTSRLPVSKARSRSSPEMPATRF
jgi:nucleotide-binding universal stress UspA family protein